MATLVGAPLPSRHCPGIAAQVSFWATPGDLCTSLGQGQMLARVTYRVVHFWASGQARRGFLHCGAPLTWVPELSTVLPHKPTKPFTAYPVL